MREVLWLYLLGGWSRELKVLIPLPVVLGKNSEVNYFQFIFIAIKIVSAKNSKTVVGHLEYKKCFFSRFLN